MQTHKCIFYLKMKNWLHGSSSNTPRLWAVSSRITCFLVSSLSKIWLSIMKWRQVFSNNFRWIPSAYEICFSNVVHATFFSLGRCVPVVRGDGVYQKGMDLCLEKLNEGQWVHIFPEGKVNEMKEAIRFKWGVGRLIMDSTLPPVVLPVFHIGMDNVLPNKMPYIPKVGKEVTIMFGEPLDFTELLDKLRKMNNSPMEIRKCITDKIQEEMLKLKDKAKGYHEQWTTANNGS